jgi:hypothetical protein
LFLFLILLVIFLREGFATEILKRRRSAALRSTAPLAEAETPETGWSID